MSYRNARCPICARFATTFAKATAVEKATAGKTRALRSIWYKGSHLATIF